MQQINPMQMVNKLTASVEQEHQQQQRASGITKKVDSLFDHLADIFGGKFNLALPDEDSEHGAKKAYADVINEQDGQTLAYGLKQLVRKKTEGQFKYLDIAEVMEFIINPHSDQMSIQKAWIEYNNRGEKINGKLQWSCDAVAETSKRCGLPQYLIGGEKEFKRHYFNVLKEIKAGAEFKQAVAIESAEKMDIRTPAQKEADRVAAAEKAFNQLFGR